MTNLTSETAARTNIALWTNIPLPKQAAAATGLADIGALKLSYWDTGGSGEVIVLNHSQAQGSACWAYQQPVLAAAGYRVIAWSRRGTDLTARGPQDDPSTAAEDLRRLLDSLGIDKCHLLGAAEGAAVATHFALENPSRVRSVVLSGARLFIDEADQHAMTARAWLPPDHGTQVHFYEVGPSYRGGNADGLKSWIELGEAAHPQGAFDSQPWGAVPLTWARMAQLNAPVMLVTAVGDHHSSAAQNRMFAQHLPNRELAVIEEAGGAAYWEQPDAFNNVVLDFLGRHRTGRADPPRIDPAPLSTWIDPISSRAPTPPIVSGPVKLWDIVPVPEQVPATEGYADTKPVKIWYWDTGGPGEPIVFCHPWSQGSECWKYQQPVFANEGYRVIAWSQRGFYKTEKGPQDDLGATSHDLHQLIEYLGIDRFHLVGCAAGGCTAISYALNHPERLYSLVLSGTILLPDEPDYKALKDNLAAAPPGVKTKVPAHFTEVGSSYRAGNPDGFAHWQELSDLAHPDGWYRGQPWGAERNWQTFSRMTVPTLLQTGDTDISAPPSLTRLFSRHFPNREMRVLREAGHAAYWEQPETFNASLMEFIKRHGGTAR